MVWSRHTTGRNDPEGNTTMKHPPDFTPRAFATALRYRYALAVVLMGGVLLALQPAPPDLIGAPLPQAHALVLSDQARRSLALEYRAFPTELMGCMIGEVHCGYSIVWVNRVAIEPHFSLLERPVVRALDQPPGNRVRAGSRVSLRGE